MLGDAPLCAEPLGGFPGTLISATSSLTDTNVMPKPIDAILMGNQPYKVARRSWEVNPPKVIMRPVMTAGGSGLVQLHHMPSELSPLEQLDD